MSEAEHLKTFLSESLKEKNNKMRINKSSKGVYLGVEVGRT